MTREVGSANEVQIGVSQLRPITFVHFAFEIPIFVHSGVGNIVFNGNTYQGVGDMGGISGVTESEQLTIGPVKFSLNALASVEIQDALDAGRFGDRITVYQGYRDSSSDLVEDPWVVTGGSFEYSEVQLGKENNVVIVTMQHDITRLSEKSGRRFSDEDQQAEFPGDTFFSFIHTLNDQTLLWGGQVVNSTPGDDGGGFNERVDDD